jgi:FtsP/CotA-like multicopper oxidase with cupredoxin domain
MGLTSVDTNGNATAAPITYDMANFGWEYMWHCHILSHEEMDMMRARMRAIALQRGARV